MKTLDIGQATEPLAEYARSAAAEPLVLTQDGRPIAALVPVDQDDLDTLALGAHPTFMAILDRSRARLRAEGSVSLDAVREELGIARSRRGKAPATRPRSAR